MKIIRTLRFAFRVLGFCVVTICCWIGLELSALLRPRCPRIDLINIWVPRWAKINLWLFQVKVSMFGPHLDDGDLYPRRGANGNGRIFVANHSSGLDIPLLLTIAEAHCISRHDVANWPLIGLGARRVGTLFVDRTSSRSGASVLKEVEEALDRGEAVAMFPEGTVNAGDEVQRFRNGAFNAARRADAEIVPIGIAYGSDSAYYTDAYFMTHIKRVSMLDELRVAVQVGEPINLDGSSSMEVKDQAHAEVQRLVNAARQKLDAQAPVAAERAPSPSEAL